MMLFWQIRATQPDAPLKPNQPKHVSALATWQLMLNSIHTAVANQKQSETIAKLRVAIMCVALDGSGISWKFQKK